MKTGVQRKKKECMTSSCSRLNLGYFRVLKNPTNQADKEVVTKGEEKGRKKDTRHHNQVLDSEVKISCDQNCIHSWVCKLKPLDGIIK